MDRRDVRVSHGGKVGEVSKAIMASSARTRSTAQQGPEHAQCAYSLRIDGRDCALAQLHPCSSGLFGRGLRRVRLARGSLLTLRKSLGFWATLARVR
jgi:hypothetical protein